MALVTHCGDSLGIVSSLGAMSLLDADHFATGFDALPDALPDDASNAIPDAI